MTSNHHAPYGLGYTRTTMAATEGSDSARRSESQKSRPSSDRSLQPDSVKMESLVIAISMPRWNTFSGLVHTAVKPWEWAMPEAGGATERERAVEGRADDWG